MEIKSRWKNSCCELIDNLYVKIVKLKKRSKIFWIDYYIQRAKASIEIVIVTYFWKNFPLLDIYFS